MTNVLALIQGDDAESLRHGGHRSYRTFKLYLNGVLLDTFRDDSPATGYNSGKYLDRHMDGCIAPLEQALGVRCIRGRLRGRYVSPFQRY